MTIRGKCNYISNSLVNDYMWKIQKYLMEKYGEKEAERNISALQWYINTGRASADFLLKLVNTKSYLIARILHNGGSDSEVIQRIKNYIKYEE